MANLVSHVSVPAPDICRAGGASYGGVVAFLAAIFFMWGFVTVLNDVLISHLKSVFELDYPQTLPTQFVFFSNYFGMALPGVKFIEWVGYTCSMEIGLAIVGAGALLSVPAATLGSCPLFLGGLFVLAAGITALQVATNPYVPVIGPSQTVSSRLNLAQAFNSLGTALAPGFGGMHLVSQSVGGTSANEVALTHMQRNCPPPGLTRGYQKLYVDHVQQADRGCDLDFLIDGSGGLVERESY
jgi:FHS family L-fucose permease-like MFS transporter